MSFACYRSDPTVRSNSITVWLVGQISQDSQDISPFSLDHWDGMKKITEGRHMILSWLKYSWRPWNAPRRAGANQAKSKLEAEQAKAIFKKHNFYMFI